MDLYSRRIVGWSLRDNMEVGLVLESLGAACLDRRPARGLLHHSDRGAQYTALAYQAALDVFGFEPSMSGKGNCYDNAAMESFFKTLKSELIHHKRFLTRAEARRAVFEYVETFYNRARLHSALGYMSPAEFEKAC